MQLCTEKTRLKFFSSKWLYNDTYLAMATILPFLVLLSPDALARSWSSFWLDMNTSAGKCNGIISFSVCVFCSSFPSVFLLHKDLWLKHVAALVIQSICPLSFPHTCSLRKKNFQAVNCLTVVTFIMQQISNVLYLLLSIIEFLKILVCLPGPLYLTGLILKKLNSW